MEGGSWSAEQTDQVQILKLDLKPPCQSKNALNLSSHQLVMLLCPDLGNEVHE